MLIHRWTCVKLQSILKYKLECISKFQHYPSFYKRITLVRSSGGLKVVFFNIVKNSFRVLGHIFHVKTKAYEILCQFCF
jgi:hypothetical protein